MVKRLAVITLLALWSLYSFAQHNDTPSPDSTSAQNAPKPKKEFIFKPTIGLGTGMFSYYGDIYDKHFQNPSVSRIAYELNVSQYFTDYLQFNFYVLFGRLGADERMTANGRNLNFESQIRAGGVNLTYNFGNFLPKDRWASPYVSVGFESFEFLSKTDLYDGQSNKYFYWSDGTIRNKAQNDPAAASAIELHRDYTYESDIRTLNYDNFGKYPERSWAVPVGVGAMMKINDYWTFKIGATMHFTFTDYIDGVSNKSVGNRVGNSKNDNFMMTSCSLHYNLGIKKKSVDTVSEDDFKDVDFYALDLQDFDKDGVPDFRDSCQGTPLGVPVDEKGCPLDDDHDGVPNNVDDEPDTPAGKLVDIHGVQLNDSTIAYQYSVYVDSTGAFAKVEYHNHNGSIYNKNNYFQKEYTVELGSFKKGLSPELMTKFLSINDISSTSLDDSTTVYTAGKFPDDLLSAENRKKELIAQGLSDAKVVYKQNSKFYDAPKYGTAAASGNGNTAGNNGNATHTTNIKGNGTVNSTTNPATNPEHGNGNNGNTGNNGNSTAGNTTHPTTNANSQTNGGATANGGAGTNNNALNQQGIVLRVQLGAYRNRLSKSVFKDINDLIEIKTDDGLYKYMTGSYTNFDGAAKHKVDMLLKGYTGAFIAAYKDGKRVSLMEAGAIMPKKDEQPEISDSSAVNGANKTLVTFKVQVGVFKNEPPADKQELYNKNKGITKETTTTGLNRYVAGAFNDYKSAVALKNELVKNGITDAFVIAFFNGEYISIQEALELAK